MKYYNLVFVNHGDSNKNYLFQVPLNISLKVGEKVFVDTSKGECIGNCVTNSFIVDEHTAEKIMTGTGAYVLKDVIGLAEKQEGYRCVHFALMDCPF